MKRRSTKLGSMLIPQVEVPAEIVPDDPDQLGNLIVSILRKPQVVRTEFENQVLKNSLRNIKFFREQFSQHYEDMLEEVCENAKLLTKMKGEMVIHQDTLGDTFYIIIKGSVKVFKKQSYLVGQKMNKKGVLVDQYQEQIKPLATLFTGDSFGEISLIENKPRAASIKCETDCSFLILDKDSFDRIIATKAKREFMHLLDHLKQNSILKELSKNSVKALFFLMEKKNYCYGDHVFKLNDPSESLYFIAQGEFKLQKEINDKGTQESAAQKQKEAKKIIHLKIAGLNECLGLEDFITESPYSYTAVCYSQQAILFRLDRHDYKRLEQRYPEVCSIISQVGVEKKQYYQEVETQMTQHKYQHTSQTEQNQQDVVSYVKSQKDLRRIMTQDNELSFISRDQVTLNEDNDIVLKFSKFFQISEQNHLPFQVNSVDQIHKNRVQSAKYRTKARVATEQHDKKKRENLITFKLQTNQTRCQSAITFQLSPKNTTNSEQTFSMAQFDQSVRKVGNSAQNREKAIMQQKVQIFLQLNQEKIEKMSKEARLEMERYHQSKPYIKPYQEKSVKTILHQMNKTSLLEPQNDPQYEIVSCHNQLQSAFFSHNPSNHECQIPKSTTKLTSPRSTRPTSARMKIKESLSKHIYTQPPIVAQYTSIHSHRKSLNEFNRKLRTTMDALQLPLKYHSGQLKLSAQKHSLNYTSQKRFQQ